MSSFFTLPTSQRKRKRETPSTTHASAPRKQPKPSSRKPQKQQEDNEDEVASDAESISSGSSSAAGSAASSDASSDHADETAAERRLRLAEQYLSNIRDEVGTDRPVGEYEFDAAEVDRELIAARLKEDVAEEKGRLHRFIASRLELGKAKSHFFKADTLATTAVAVCGNTVYTASKDMRLIKWETPSQNLKRDGILQASVHGSKRNRPPRTKPKLLQYTRGNHHEYNNPSYAHHTRPILCLATSHDGTFLASGCSDRKVIIWDTSTLKPLKVFTQHRDAVTSLAFRGKTGQLFSGSKDRTVKIWSCTGEGGNKQAAYVDTLFGHQDGVVDVAAVGGTQERCVSVGARDRTARLWKVVEESQLVFRGGGAPPGTHSKGVSKGTQQAARPRDQGVNGETRADDTTSTPAFNETSLDRITQIDTQLFVTGSDSGAISLYSLHKKKALHVYPLAHGFDPPPPDFLSSADAAVPSLTADGMVADGGGQHKRLDSEGGDEAGIDSAVEVDRAPQHKLPEGTRAPFSNAFNAPPTPRWITALKAIPYTDLFVSGSWDGFVRVWRVTQEASQAVQGGDADVEGEDGRDGAHGKTGQGKWRIAPVGMLGVLEAETAQPQPLKGIVNDLAISALGPQGEDGVRIVAALGKEMRLGRWKSDGRTDSGGQGCESKHEKRRGPGNGAVMWEISLRKS